MKISFSKVTGILLSSIMMKLQQTVNRMNTRKLITVATQHGGSWYHIEKALISEGASRSFASDFVSFMKSSLSVKHQLDCLSIYDLFVDKGEQHTKFFIYIVQPPGHTYFRREDRTNLSKM
ncbi:hypothetical protein BC455_17965 [Vibrio harveyi]|nr:hypothetical protein BC455_17965 [Vibrio harveyi]